MTRVAFDATARRSGVSQRCEATVCLAADDCGVAYVRRNVAIPAFHRNKRPPGVCVVVSVLALRGSALARHPHLWLFVAALMLACGGAGYADGAGNEVEKIAPGVYMRPGKYAVVFEQDDIANIGFVVGEKCVAVIDTGGSEAEGRALKAEIARITQVPICFIIITHAHPDHMLGTLAFKGKGVSVIGHHKLARAQSLTGPTYLERAAQHEQRVLGPHYIIPPDRTVEDELELDLGGRSLKVTAHPTAHTDHDLSVLDTHTGTLWLSDLLFIDYIPVVDGSINGWIAALEALMQQPAERAVPGHGPVTPWPQAAGDLLRYLETLRADIRELIADGGDISEAQMSAG
ncbi:MAG: quinoprotein relay system zinc metallohydrolase 2, partial [Gammaproteobacteria bacterium]